MLRSDSVAQGNNYQLSNSDNCYTTNFVSLMYDFTET